MKDLFDNLEEYIAAIILFIMVIFGFLQIIFRFFLNLPLGWTEESMVYLFVWFIYLGASAVTKRNKHPRVELVMNKLPPFLQRYVELFVDILWIFFCLVIFWMGYKVFFFFLVHPTFSIAANLPRWLGYLAVPVGMLLMVFRVFQHILSNHKTQ